MSAFYSISGMKQSGLGQPQIEAAEGGIRITTSRMLGDLQKLIAVFSV